MLGKKTLCWLAAADFRAFSGCEDAIESTSPAPPGTELPPGGVAQVRLGLQRPRGALCHAARATPGGLVVQPATGERHIRFEGGSLKTAR